MRGIARHAEPRLRPLPTLRRQCAQASKLSVRRRPLGCRGAGFRRERQDSPIDAQGDGVDLVADPANCGCALRFSVGARGRFAWD